MPCKNMYHLSQNSKELMTKIDETDLKYESKTDLLKSLLDSKINQVDLTAKNQTEKIIEKFQHNITQK